MNNEEMSHGKDTLDVHDRSLTAVCDMLQMSRSYVLSTHREPDGDGLACEVVLAEALEQMGKQVRVINTDPVPGMYRFMKRTETFVTYDAVKDDRLLNDHEVVVLVDADHPERTDRMEGALLAYPGSTLVIDHHVNRRQWAKVAFIRSSAAATAILIDMIVRRLPVKLTPSMAEALYTGIAFDTQGFRGLNTTPDAHRRAARLMEEGADIERIHEALYGSWPIGHQGLLGQFLTSLRAVASGQVVYGVVRQQDLERWQQTSEDVTGFVEQALSVGGAKVAVLFQEAGGNEVRVSFRSRGDAKVDSLARSLGGGGHVRAAGARVAGPIDEVIEKVLQQIEATFNNSRNG